MALVFRRLASLGQTAHPLVLGAQAQQRLAQFLVNVRAASSGSALKRTALYEFHVEHGGKMVPFAGYEMPVLYSDLSIRDSHLHTRAHASLFDVSHMLQVEIRGRHRVPFIESLVVADVESLPDDGGTLTLFTTDSGGIIDDLIVNKLQDRLYIVSNAARAKEDLEHMERAMHEFRSKHQADISLEILHDKSLLALQGPEAEKALQAIVPIDLKKFKFMRGCETSVDGTAIRVTRCGYTGEDGFEISLPSAQVTQIANKMLELTTASVKLAGLGARDSLRLEAGLCLYGNDIDMNSTPIEAGLAWTIPKSRRERGDFPGASVILGQIKQKPKRRRVGLVASGGVSGPPVRAGSSIHPTLDSGIEPIGSVTSGCPSPSLGHNIAMGYVPSQFAKVGTQLYCEVRGKRYQYQVAKMPFISTHYYI